VVANVRPGSIAAELGLRPGDRLCEVNGSPLRDYIDYRYLTAEPLVELRVIRPCGEDLIFEVEKDPDEDLGLVFTADIFGDPPQVRTCTNKCVFCFVDRLPPGLRPALYVKDDDYRLSFLHGNFVTLTNLTPEDLARIEAMRLSPLYVSVHSTEPALRARLMGSPRAAAVMDDLCRLIRAGVSVHAQIVVCPGLNDGPHLERSLEDLASLRPGVESVGVVPVGLSRFGPPSAPVRRLTPAECEALLETLLRWHRETDGFVFPADELLLVTGSPVPGARFYRGFPQLENGIGLVRLFLDDLARVRRRGGPAADGAVAGATHGAAGRAGVNTGPGGGPPEKGFVVVTGTLARPYVERAVEAVSRRLGVEGEVVEVRNEFLGPSVTVAGLLAGKDVLEATRKVAHGRPVLVPGSALRAGSDDFLDGVSLGDLSAATGTRFVDGGWLPSHMLNTLRDLGRREGT
jgi:putative radical SAM enzyme (TIGR03279 family)